VCPFETTPSPPPRGLVQIKEEEEEQRIGKVTMSTEEQLQGEGPIIYRGNMTTN